MAKRPTLSKNVTGAVMIGSDQLLRQLRNFTMVGTKGVSDSIHRQANRLAKEIRIHPFVRDHRGLSKAVEVDRFKQRGTFIGSFVRIDYDVAVENVEGDWPGKRWLTLVWEYGNHHMSGKRFVTNTWLRMKKRLVTSLEADLKRAVLVKAADINKRVDSEVKSGMR